MLYTFCPVFQFLCDWRENLLLVITFRLQMSVFSFEIWLWNDLSECWGERLHLIHTSIPNAYYRAGYRLCSHLVFWSRCFTCYMYAIFCSPWAYHFVLVSLNPSLVAYRFNLVCKKELLFVVRSLVFYCWFFHRCATTCESQILYSFLKFLWKENPCTAYHKRLPKELKKKKWWIWLTFEW